MARKLTYNINRFDGGMTSSPRDVTQRDRFAYLSHFDIYRDTGKMHVMPGFVSDNAYGGSATGLKVYKVRGFTDLFGTVIIGVGNKSDGTGSKVFVRQIADSEWILPTSFGWDSEGTNNLVARPFIIYPSSGSSDVYYPTNSAGTANLTRNGAGVPGVNDSFGTIRVGFGTSTQNFIVERGFNGVDYICSPGSANASSLSGTTFTQNAKTTVAGLYDIQSANYQIGLAGSSNPRSRVLLWDSASLLADENINLGTGRVRVIGYPSNIWSFVVSEGEDELNGNGNSQMSVKYANGETIETRYTLDSETSTSRDIFSIRTQYRDTMTWYARIPTNSGATEFREGVWAFGKGRDTAQLGVSVLLDTSSLGDVINARWFGNTLLLAHSDDGSVSRLDNFDTGTYDVTATAETVWYGNETPYQKELNGISIVTNPLPSGGQVEMFYRVNDSASWTSMGTSTTTGKMKHVFTKVAGVPIGKFQEIQFKFEVLGKVSVQNVFINLTETDDLAF